MQRYGFTKEDLDYYIINYDILLRSLSYAGHVKYRMGKDLQEDGA